MHGPTPKSSQSVWSLQALLKFCLCVSNAPAPQTRTFSAWHTIRSAPRRVQVPGVHPHWLMAKKKKNHNAQLPLDQQIVRLLARSEAPLSSSNLMRKLSDQAGSQKIKDRLRRLVQAGTVLETPSGKYKLHTSRKEHMVLTGTVDMTASGSAYVIVQGLEQDIYVPASKTGRAFDGDQVRVVLTGRKGKGRAEGEIVEVINRAKEHYVGTLEINRGIAFVVPMNRRGMRDIFLPPEEWQGKEGLAHGDRVAVEITDWPHRSGSPAGRIAHVLGPAEENETEMRSILLSAGFPLRFSEEAGAEAQAYPDELDAAELERRRDFRAHTVFTIDPEDAKDFDDALSLKRLDNGHWEVGVHIADVSHYVMPGTALDKEAYRRATSVYLVDRVNPMLPERLSNELCSLRPEEDKLVFSAVFELDDKARMHAEWFGRGVIHSRRRFTYREAQDSLDQGHGPFHQELNALNQLARKLRARRFEEGSVGFETQEVRFRLDESGKPLGIYVKERLEVHQLIEDFMLLANRRVAQFLADHRKKDSTWPSVYRVHDLPDPEKLQAFETLVREHGYKLKLPENPVALARALNEFMQSLEGQPEQEVLNRMAVRAMAKAIYTTENIGHFGLGFDYYTHFTSPIRRYPDLMVHRLLAQVLGDPSTENAPRPDKNLLEEQCRHASQMERKAMDAEYESIKYKQAEFLSEHIGEVFEGRITGITTWGIYVELLESRCEGMIRLDSLGSEFVHNEKKNTLYAVEEERMFRMGDTLHIAVKDVSLARREMTFVLAPDPEDEP
jgi:ribonuclease R